MKDLSIEWTTEQEEGFVNRMETLPECVNLDDQLQRVGIPKNKYNSWVKKYGVSAIYAPVLEGIDRVNPDVVTMFESHPSIKSKGKKYSHKVELTVHLESLEELRELVVNLQNVPNVFNIGSVGDTSELED